MDLTLICTGKTEHSYKGHHTYTLEFSNTEDIQDGILDATFHLETSNPELVERYRINESYVFHFPDP